MAGIYLHIPFCKQACSYCDFHFSTSLSRKQEMVDAIALELGNRKKELDANVIETIYFGGGTPSLLETKDIDKLLGQINQDFDVDENVEITLEANPDDLVQSKLKELAASPINRLSIGVQSFIDRDLIFMNRAHRSNEAINSIKNAQDLGFNNINVDLIYGFNQLSAEEWRQNLDYLNQLDVQHLSAYSFTVEKNTLIDRLIEKGKEMPIEDEKAADHFKYLMQWAKDNDWDHYEISNFSKRGMQSRHNTAYWQGNFYLGVGPSAHSFNGNQRRWNVSNNATYMKNLGTGEAYFDSETLQLNDRFNEYIMTSTRTKWGLSEEEIISKFGIQFWETNQKRIETMIASGELVIHSNRICLTEKGKLVADKIASDLFVIDD